MNKSMQEKWDVLLTQKRHRLKYPNEQVVQFLFRNFKRDGSSRILDLGCGAGRHVFLMAGENFDTYATDISQEGVEYAESWLVENGLKACFKVCFADELPFEDNFFDGIVCWHVLVYCSSAEARKAVEEMWRVLKPGGKGLLYVRNPQDFRYGRGREIEKNTFVIEETDESRPSYSENGMVMHFFERDELADYFRNFSKVTIDRIVETHENEKYCDSNFIAVFEK